MSEHCLTELRSETRTPRRLKWYTSEAEAEIVAAQCLEGRLVPEDIAAMALCLASADARLITSGCR